MNLADLSIRRPVFITALVAVIVIIGVMAFRNLPVDLYPDVDLPIVTVTTLYPGAGPEEIETLLSRVLEDEVSTVPGIRTLRSISNEGVSTVIAEFELEVDIRDAEQLVRDRVGSARRRMPQDVEESVIKRLDPSDQPIMILSLTAELPDAKLYDLADSQVRPSLEQVPQVGLIEIVGGRKREIRIELDRDKLRNYELAATMVSQRIAAAGQNIPAGTVERAQTETVFRTVGEFESINDIGSVIIRFLGNDVPVTVRDVGKVVDTVEDQKSRAYLNGEKSVFLLVYRQSGANTIAVANAVKDQVTSINKNIGKLAGAGTVQVVRDESKVIRANVDDVQEAILIGIILTIIVVYLFLGSGRSTFITGLAIPNSLIGAFFLMYLAGFTINIMTLLALSLAVGLLIDDAIVVRENIFRHTELGKSAIRAASEGTKEVLMAVTATTLAVVAVFAPIGFLSGIVGQFFQEFGLTVCFAMAISLFDAVTMAPMLSAYFAGRRRIRESQPSWLALQAKKILVGFDRMQGHLEEKYEASLRKALGYPISILAGAAVIFLISLLAANFIPKTFIPPSDAGEFAVSLDLPPGTSLDAITLEAARVDAAIRQNEEVATTVMFLGGSNTQANAGTIFVSLVPMRERNISTTEMKSKVREQLEAFPQARPIVQDVGGLGGTTRPFTLNIIGSDLDQIQVMSEKVLARLEKHPGLVDVDTTYRTGRPEFQVVPDKYKAEQLGVATNMIGQELRTLIEGSVPALFREGGEEYDIRVRLQDDQRDLQQAFNRTYVPNVNQSLVRLSEVANPLETVGPAAILRQDRGRYIQIGGDLVAGGPGLGSVIQDVNEIFREEIRLPSGMRYSFVGQAESYQELVSSVLIAVVLGVLFIYLVMASLYESFVTPFAILLVLPLAACGAFFALWITNESLNVFSMIGCILLLGVATKNSILLVDYTNQLIKEGKNVREAIITSGRVRLRPILMTSLALIAGMLPIAIGLNEASRQRTAMGIAVVGGLISSTILTLYVVPAAYAYLERFRRWSGSWVRRWVGTDETSQMLRS